MSGLRIQFMGNLNDFLPLHQRGREFTLTFNDGQTFKHLIESLGAPHPEIAGIMVNGCHADLNQIAWPDCAVVVIPYEPGDPRIRPADIRFVLDGHLGKLCSYLRILGFDVSYTFEAKDETLAAVSANENRILLTRDRGLLKRNQVVFGYCVRDQYPRRQLLEIIRRYDLMRELHPFTRCPRCNGILIPVEKSAVRDRLPANAILLFDRFWQCQDCQQVYWQGSHCQRIQDWLNTLDANF